jgi:BASS family bile acid:Na+ symporter
VLHAAGWVAAGEYADALRGLAAGGVSSFLAVYVLAPSVAGILARAAIGEARAVRVRPHLKVSGTAALLALCYANAAAALPQTVREPDWDYLAVMLLVVALMCVGGFAAGGALGRLLGADRAQRASLMFGLGMSNNGTGLVVAAGALAHLPAVMLPIICYNLVQHVVAGCADRYWSQPGGARPPEQGHPLTAAA